MTSNPLAPLSSTLQNGLPLVQQENTTNPHLVAQVTAPHFQSKTPAPASAASSEDTSLSKEDLAEFDAILWDPVTSIQEQAQEVSQGVSEEVQKISAYFLRRFQNAFSLSAWNKSINRWIRTQSKVRAHDALLRKAPSELSELLSVSQKALRENRALTFEELASVKAFISRLDPEEFPNCYDYLQEEVLSGEKLKQFYHTVEKESADAQGLVPHLFTELKGMTQRTLSPASVSQEEIPTTPSEEGEISFLRFLETAYRWTGSLLKDSQTALTQSTLSAFTAALVMGAQKALDYLDPTNYPQAHEALRQFLQGLLSLQTTHNWEGLPSLIQKCIQEIGRHQIYLHGIRVPRLRRKSETSSDLSAIPQFVDNINTVSDPSLETAKTDHRVLLARMESEKKELIDRTTRYTVLKVIYESICGLPSLKHENYCTLLKEAASRGERAKDYLKTQLFERIDHAHIFVFKKWVAKAAYYVIYPLIQFLVAQFASRFVEGLRRDINQGDQEKLEALRDLTIKNLTGYMEILNGIYRRIAKTDQIHGALPAMVEKELAEPQFNHNLSSEQLYGKVAEIAVRAYAPRLEFSHYFSNLGERVRLPSNRLFTRIAPVIRSLANALGVLLSSLMAVPEWGINYAISWALRKFARKIDVIPTILETSLRGFKNHTGYTHALNSTLYEQLSAIWDALQKNQRNLLSAKPPLRDTQSSSRKADLAALVKSLFQVLDKSKHSTHEELKRFVEDKSFLMRLDETVDGLFVEDIVGTAVSLISTSYEAIMQKEQLEIRLFHFLRLINKTYEPDYTADENIFKNTEEAVSEIIDKILDFSIQHAIQNKFDFSGKKLEQEAHRSFEALKTQIQQDLQTLLQTLEAGSSSPSLEELLHKQDSLRKLYYYAQKKESDFEKEHIGGNRLFDKETQDKLRSILSLSANGFAPVGKSLQLCQKIKEKEEAIEKTLQVEPLATQLEQAVQQKNFATCRQLLQSLKKPLEILCLEESEFQPAIRSFLQKIANLMGTLQDIEDAQAKLDPQRNTTKAVLEGKTALFLETLAESRLIIFPYLESLRDKEIERKESYKQFLTQQFFSMREKLLEMRKEVDKIQPISFLNLQITDTEWFLKPMRDLAFDRVKQRVNKLVEFFLRQPYNVRYGLFHHLIFLPFVERNKKE